MESTPPKDASDKPALLTTLRTNHHYAWLLLAILVFTLMAVRFWNFSIDDVFISFRYADHIAQGHGIVFNVGEAPVEGFSNFLWVLVLTCCGWFGADIEASAHVLGFVIGLINLLLVFTVSRNLWAPMRYWWTPVLLVAAVPEWTLWSMSGLELSIWGMFLLLIVLGFQSAGVRRTILLVAGCMGMTMTRPEGIALAVAALGTALLASSDLSWRERWQVYGVPLAASAITAIGLALFRLWYFGYPLPNTIYAKSGGLWSTQQTIDWLLFLVPFLICWTVTLRITKSPRQRVILWASGAVVLAQVLITLPVHPIMYFLFRYQIALLPLVMLAVPAALDALASRHATAGALVATLLVAWSLQGWPYVDQRHELDQSAIAIQQRVADYLVTLPADPTIALVDAGRIPYWSRLRTHDAWGLCDAEWGHKGFDVASLVERRPDVYVMSAYTDATGLARPWIREDVLVMHHAAFYSNYGISFVFEDTISTSNLQYGYGIWLDLQYASNHGLYAEKVGPR